MKIVITALIKIKIVHLEDLNVAIAVWPPGMVWHNTAFCAALRIQLATWPVGRYRKRLGGGKKCCMRNFLFIYTLILLLTLLLCHCATCCTLKVLEFLWNSAVFEKSCGCLNRISLCVLVSGSEFSGSGLVQLVWQP